MMLGVLGKNFFACVFKEYSKDFLKMDFVSSWPKNMSLLELLWP